MKYLLHYTISDNALGYLFGNIRQCFLFTLNNIGNPNKDEILNRTNPLLTNNNQIILLILPAFTNLCSKLLFLDQYISDIYHKNSRNIFSYCRQVEFEIIVAMQLPLKVNLKETKRNILYFLNQISDIFFYTGGLTNKYI